MWSMILAIVGFLFNVEFHVAHNSTRRRIGRFEPEYLIAHFFVISGEMVALQAYEYPDGQTGVSRREEHNRLMAH